MCKSKSTIPSDQLLNYVVILEKEASPKVLEKDISHELVNYKREDTELNLWALDYKGDLKKEKLIMAELLNHPKVVSAFTKVLYEKIKLKKGKKAQKGSQGNREATKQ